MADEDLLPPRSFVYDGKRSMEGYRINALAQSMRHAANREAFLANEAAYMAKMGLSSQEQALVTRRDWLGLQAAGANQYALVKLCGTVGVSLVREGAAIRGESFEEFMKTRHIKGGNAR